MKKNDDKKQINEQVSTVQESDEMARIVAEHEQKIEEWKNKYVRALADYQNLARRTQDEKIEVRKYAEEAVLSRLLPVLDTFYKANQHLKDPGLGLAIREFEAVLEECGVKKIKSVGEKFNPHEMECIEVVEGDDEVVTEEVTAGFRYHDRILKVAQVKVGKKFSH